MTGRYQEAVEAYRSVILLLQARQQPEIIINDNKLRLFNLLVLTGDHSSAEQALNLKPISLMPTNQLLLAECALIGGNAEAFESHFKKALELNSIPYWNFHTENYPFFREQIREDISLLRKAECDEKKLNWMESQIKE